MMPSPRYRQGWGTVRSAYRQINGRTGPEIWPWRVGWGQGMWRGEVDVADPLVKNWFWGWAETVAAATGLTAVAQTLILLWDMIGVVAKTQQLVWDIMQLAAQTKQFVWDISGGAGSTPGSYRRTGWKERKEKRRRS